MRESLQHYRVLAEENPGKFRPRLAWELSNAGVYLNRFQCWEEARGATADVALYRTLAECDPATHTANLARSLNNLGVWLIRLGHQQDARATLAEAVRLRERLVQRMPESRKTAHIKCRGLIAHLDLNLADAGY